MLRTRLRLLKATKGVTWNDVSVATGISPSTLSQLASDRKWTTNSRYIDALCRYFDCTADQLLEFVNTPGVPRSVCHIDHLYPGHRRRAPAPTLTTVAPNVTPVPPAPSGAPVAPAGVTPLPLPRVTATPKRRPARPSGTASRARRPRG